MEIFDAYRNRRKEYEPLTKAEELFMREVLERNKNVIPGLVVKRSGAVNYTDGVIGVYQAMDILDKLKEENKITEAQKELLVACELWTQESNHYYRYLKDWF